MSLIELLWPAFVLAIALVLVHTIFGLEIIRRGVIFTDLAIGQIAAIGMAISIAFLEGAYQNTLTLFFAILGALFITYATKRIRNIEAFIGLLYALAIASVMLILAKSTEGAELFSKLSAADILFTSSDDLVRSVSLYSMIALLMVFLYPRLKGLVKELAFFLLLAVTVTSSVQSAGVLVVFSLLIAPAYAGLYQSRWRPFTFASVFGSIAVVVALFGSYQLDLPTGYTIIFVTVLTSLLFVLAHPKTYKKITPVIEYPLL